jgi:DNA-binding NarL/FixJ family response regulator
MEPQVKPLTVRQAQIVRLIAMGCLDKQIAKVLGISEETVGHHLRVAFRQHNVHSRAALVATVTLLQRSQFDTKRA